MKTLEQLYGDEYDAHLYADVVPGQSVVEKVFAENQPTIKNVPQSAYQKGLELAGINLDQAAQFLEGLGSVNIGGIDFTLRDLLPIDKGVSEALKSAGSGMDITTGKGMTKNLRPEFDQAAVELALLGPAAKVIEKGIGAMAKSALKNKGKVAAGVAATAASENRVKYDAQGKRTQ